MLRLIRRTPGPAEAGVRILGVDDWAWRRGQRYGTLLVDLEQRRPVDLLPDRTAEALVAWLQAHPGVEVISRDRGGAYADGARRGAPDAIQVADRWHLLRNLADTLERLFDRQPASLRAATAISATADPAPQTDDAILPESQPPVMPPTAAATPPQAEVLRQARRAKRLARYEAVRQLHQQGASQRIIACQLKIGRGTIRRYLNASTFPEIAQHHSPPAFWIPSCPIWRSAGRRVVTTAFSSGARSARAATPAPAPCCRAGSHNNAACCRRVPNLPQKVNGHDRFDHPQRPDHSLLGGQRFSC